jgi:hypothetical protein
VYVLDKKITDLNHDELDFLRVRMGFLF